MRKSEKFRRDWNDRYLQRHILKGLEQHLVLAMDEVDRVFDTNFRNDFFGMLRSWHNSRAIYPSLDKLDLVLVTSTEPYQLIETIASGSGDKTVRLWNFQGELLKTLTGHSNYVNGVAFSPDGKTIASGSWDNTVRLWNLNLDDLLRRGCAWISDYLKNNPNVNKDDRRLCDDIAKRK